MDANAVLGAYTTLGANARVAERAEVQRSVIGENSYLGPGARVEGAVLGRSCDLRVGARIEPGAVLGEGCLVGAHAEVRGDVKVYPYKVVEAGAQVNASIVWESGGARTLFGREGVMGIANVDVSPELAVRLAKAWASGFEKGSSITASRDTSRAARVLKRALMVGCNAVGVNVADLELATVPVTRHQIRARGTRGGADRAAERRRPAVGRHPLLRRARHRPVRDGRAARRAHVPPRGVPARHRRRRSATSTSHPGLSSTTRATWSKPSGSAARTTIT